MPERLTAGQARRIAIAAQGLADARPTGRVTARHLHRVFDRVGVVQIDSVNVLVRSQELPLFARLGQHPRDLLPAATDRGELFEYWVHAASHLPTRDHRLVRWRMEEHARRRPWPSMEKALRRRPRLLDEVLGRVRSDGPILASDVRTRTGPKGAWWDWDEGKDALEYLFWIGELGARRRASDFARLYDLPERIVPSEHLAAPTPDPDDARAELLERAAAHLGVATHAQLADYHRLPLTGTRPLISRLVDEGRIVPVHVSGWSRTAYVHPQARRPRRVHARALLSPFDSLVWNRDRNLDLWDFHYRIEIYTPAARRTYGYYVLPFLLGEVVVARVDLKADRSRSTLCVPGAFAEPGATAPVTAIAAELAEELGLMATWLGLETIEVGERGDLTMPLRRAVSASAPARRP